MKKLLRGLLASAMLTTTVLSSGPGIVFAADDSGSADTEYEVIEDAYVRAGGNANRNYNYENITKAHGEQYVGKNLKALSTKNNNGSSNEIMTLMKFPIPDAAEIEENSSIILNWYSISSRMRITIPEIRLTASIIPRTQTGARLL